MVLVPPGPFYMGCNAYVTGGCDADQYPQHLVDTPVYCIDTFEVSRWDYSQCVGSGCVAAASGTNCNGDQPDKDQHPINCVTWDQARTYCEARGARLCSEAEWEKAARGGCELLAGDCAPSMLTFPWGNDCPQAWGGTCAGEGWDAGTAKANCAKSLCQDDYEFTAPVDAFSADPSPYLLVAMAGNVMEWVEDCNHDSYDPDGDGQVDAPTDGQAWVDGCSSTGRVVRGGNWNSAVAAALAASDRGAVNPGSAVSGIGFRCCKDFLP
jgi:iron(II)-dependent oxidoreductase